MKRNEYERLPLRDRVAIVTDKGKLIATTFFENAIVHLYSLGSHLIEVYIDKESRIVVLAETCLNTSVLMKYVEWLSLQKLLTEARFPGTDPEISDLPIT